MPAIVPAVATAVLQAMPADQPYQIMPPQDADSFVGMKADIAARGIVEVIHLDAAGRIIDGHHRMRAWHELKAEGIELPPPPFQIHAIDDEEEKIALAVILNSLRRHMSIEDKRALCESLAARGKSRRQIADLTGIPKSTVQRLLAPPPTVPNGTPADLPPLTIIHERQTIGDVYDRLRTGHMRSWNDIADVPGNLTTDLEFGAFMHAIDIMLDGPQVAMQRLIERATWRVYDVARPAGCRQRADLRFADMTETEWEHWSAALDNVLAAAKATP